MIHFHYTDTEINKILKTLTVIMDSREKSSMHITDYFRQKDIPMKIKKLDVGDYSFMIPANPEMNIMRDIYFNSYVERKNSVDEICGNLQKDKQQAFINELIRSQDSNFVLFVEDPKFDENIAQHKYRSRYEPKALKGRLESFKAKYKFEIVPMSQTMIGHNIYHRFYYQAKHYLKTGMF
ncbi:ERCC4 domain-containing protein [Bacillus pseudomycoides]|uniref:Nuclease n=1 Tax=Bacillus pseudomycoides TaxID=64104 RepID=A0ABD6TAQ5_9BACI|nr:ERCC4 domain-containing protein [Bacillus pseudomycoides]PEM36737.1 nuclease [Bacillus pseudomycoides]PHA82777.1 nuclease [Bacillus pseudomycoides]PHC77454.1 nuclease [Bacillus pseudomycoides]PHF01923.1 nuclease [Bacillus pseudomycoides]